MILLVSSLPKYSLKDTVEKIVNCQLGKIYKIVDLDNNKCYVGSTCEPA